MTESVNQTYELTVPEDTKGRLDKVLASLIPDVSRSRLKSIIQDGFVQLDDVLTTDPAVKITTGQMLDVVIPPLEEADPQPENIPLDIVYEDEDIVVINKPAGLVVHPAPGHWQGTLVNALLYHCAEDLSGIGGVKRPGIVHRLDKDTSGLMVVAKNDAAHQGLSVQFVERSLSRSYKALVWGLPKTVQGTVDEPIGRSKTNRKKMAVLEEGFGKESVTHYSLDEGFGMNAAVVVCKLETGRTHQIRVHMAHVNHGVVGDITYGKRPKSVSQNFERSLTEGLATGRHLLHAYQLELIHPRTKEEMVFEADMPEDFSNVINNGRALIGKQVK